MSAIAMDGEKDLTTTAVEVLVRFKTRYEQYRVTEESIAIPTRLKRFGLSDIVNHLLQLPKAIPFDFSSILPISLWIQKGIPLIPLQIF